MSVDAPVLLDDELGRLDSPHWDAPASGTQLAQLRQLFAADQGANSDFASRVVIQGYAGTMKTSYLRSLLWRVLLGTLPCDTSHVKRIHERESTVVVHQEPLDELRNWSTAQREARVAYYELRKGYEDPKATDQEVERIVRKDLARLDFGGDTKTLFSHEAIQALMRNVLVVWAGENPDVAYRQGMHEILACFVLAAARDARRRHSEWVHGAPGSRDKDAALLSEILDPAHVEADCYALFDALLIRFDMIELYRTEPKSAPDDSTPEGADPEPPVVTLAHQIQNQLLAKKLPRLSRHLQALKLEPQLYLLRWLRLLFVREFPLEDCLSLWDAIFTDLCVANDLTGFISWLSLAMLQYIEQDLLIGDYEGTLLKLMKYPHARDMSVFVKSALWFIHPDGALFHKIASQASQPSTKSIEPAEPVEEISKARSRRKELFQYSDDEEEAVPKPAAQKTAHKPTSGQRFYQQNDTFEIVQEVPRPLPTSVKRDPSLVEKEAQEFRRAEEGNVLRHEEVLTDGLLRLLQEHTTCDASLVGLPEDFPVHKVLLAAGSPVFLEQFQTQKEINVGTSAVVACRAVVEYIYSGSVALTEVTVAEITALAGRWKITSLLQRCSDFMVARMDNSVALQFLETGFVFSLEPVMQAALHNCKGNLWAAIEYGELASLSLDAFRWLLGHKKELRIEEVRLFEGIVKWGKLHCEGENLRGVVDPLLSFVRFAAMKPEHLRDTVRPTKILSLEEYAKALEEATC